MTRIAIKLSTVFAAIFILFIASCTKETNYGPVVSQTLDIQNFEGVELASSEDVTIIQGNNFKVIAIGNQDILSKISKTVTNNIWEILLVSGNYSNYELRYEITMPVLTSLVVSGSGNITTENFYSPYQLTNSVSGSGNIYLNNFYGSGTLIAEISGSGNIIALGYTNSFQQLLVSISGSGNYHGFSVVTDQCSATISGSGNAEVNVRNSMNVSISGSGNMSYKGRPTIDLNKTGSGNLIDAN